MQPAPSLIVFTVLSGMGFGLLALLNLLPPAGIAAFWGFGAGYALVLAGLAASALHLGRPSRAWRAFSQWRTSWLSREAVLAAAALLVTAPQAASVVFRGTALPWVGYSGAALCLSAVLATAMIYAQLRSVPRWHSPTTPAVFLTAALAGGAMLAGLDLLAQLALPWLAVALALHWIRGDTALARSGATAGAATGLGAIGSVRQLEPPHTGQNYLLREMVHVVGRRHARRLRAIALGLGCLIPALVLALLPGWPAQALALASHLTGMLAARWLFFAEAEHVVGLYYGRR